MMKREMVRKTTRRLKNKQLGWKIAEYACQFGAVWFMLAAVLMLADAGQQAGVSAVLLYMGWAVGMSLAGLVMLAFAMEFGRKAVNTSLVAMLVVCCYDAQRMKPGWVLRQRCRCRRLARSDGTGRAARDERTRRVGDHLNTILYF